MRAKQLSTIVAVGLILATGGPARATAITMQMGGEITYSDHPLLTGMNVGDAWSIVYTFDSNALDQSSDPDLGQYDQDSFSMTVNGQAVAVEYPGMLDVRNDWGVSPGPLYDDYNVYASLSPFSGQGWPALRVFLEDHEAFVFSGDSLPLNPLSLGEFESVGLRITDVLNGGYEVRGSVAYWTPEPAAFLLFVLGGVLVIRPRKRKPVC